MSHTDRLRAIVRDIATHGETEAMRLAAQAALDEPEFAALPALGLVIGRSRYAAALIAAIFEAWNRGA